MKLRIVTKNERAATCEILNAETGENTGLRVSGLSIRIDTKTGLVMATLELPVSQLDVTAELEALICRP